MSVPSEMEAREVSLTLSPPEAALLLRLLTQYLGDLRVEIHHTDAYDFRQGLKGEEVMIKNIIQRLAATGVTPA